MSEPKKDATAPAGAFSRTIVVATILVGVFTFCAFIVLSAYAPALRDGNNGGGHALSKSAAGYAFLAALLGDAGVTVLAPRGRIPDMRDGALVYTPGDLTAMEDTELDPYQITVVVLPKWRTMPEPGGRGWVRRTGLVLQQPLDITLGDKEFSIETGRRTQTETIILEAADAGGGAILHITPTLNIGAIENLQYLQAGDDINPMLVTRDGDILFAKLKDAPVYIVSDADLANTYGLANVDRAVVTAAFFNYVRAGGPVIFDLTLHGIERTRNIVRLALEPPFLAATLCALLAAFLLALKAAVRFGPARAARRPFDSGKAALADNSAALVRMARRETAFGGRYADLTRRRIAKAIGAPKSLSAPALDALIEKVSPVKKGPSFSELTRRAAAADNPVDFVKSAIRLYQAKKEIARDHR